MEVKPCPFCGAQDTDFTWDEEGNFFVMCFDCGATGPNVSHEHYGSSEDDKRNAAAKWNDRK